MELNSGTKSVSVLSGTPVAKKTRRAVKKKQHDDFLGEGEGDLFTSLTETPRRAQINPPRLTQTETPRRSARKSVRPTMDYDDIIEKNFMRSANKDHNWDQIPYANIEEENTGQKWSVAEVGRHSRKRGRKSKRMTQQKKSKKQHEVEEDQDKFETATEEEEEPNSTVADVIQAMAAAADVEEAVSKTPLVDTNIIPFKAGILVPEAKEEAVDQVQDIIQPNVADTPMTTGLQSQSKVEESVSNVLLENMLSSQPKTAGLHTELDIVESQTAAGATPKTKQYTGDNNGSKVGEAAELGTHLSGKDKNKSKASVAETEIQKNLILPGIETFTQFQAGALNLAAEDMDELGLCPLDANADLTEEENNEEMPSLILVDDGEDMLNRTFTADEKSSDDEAEYMPPLITADDEPERQLIIKPLPAIKTVLTNDEDLNGNKSKAFRFPTPFKLKSKKHFEFSDIANCNTLQLPSNSEDLKVSCSMRRRSKSISELNENRNNKTVSFYSPIEVTAVNDIDKRWDKLNRSHITQRRKRSISLDCQPMKSRIPKPKFFAPVEKKAITPSKLMPRKKLPNFAAIHEKQFNKMENLVEHMERKAVRAKELINSTTKSAPTFGSAQKMSARKQGLTNKTATAVATRPWVLQKLDLPSYTQPSMTEEKTVQKKLQTPRKIITAKPPPTKPAFNLSTSVKYAFGSTSNISVLASGSNYNNRADESVQNKLQNRRQRHMEMFKGRPAKEKKDAFIQGVRSNRRFELQMKHRRQMDENNL